MLVDMHFAILASVNTLLIMGDAQSQDLTLVFQTLERFLIDVFP